MSPMRLRLRLSKRVILLGVGVKGPLGAKDNSGRCRVKGAGVCFGSVPSHLVPNESGKEVILLPFHALWCAQASWEGADSNGMDRFVS